MIPYPDLVKVLKKDDEAFLEDDGDLKRGTIWRAARRLSELVGCPVRAERAVLRFPNGKEVQGYSFSLQHTPREKQSRHR